MATNATQLQLALIPHEEQGNLINQRLMDGYINATALCKASGKDFYDYSRLKVTQDFIAELSTETGIPGSALIQIVRGGVPEHQGTWVHPQVAIHLGQWASPKFAVLVSKWVFDWMTGRLIQIKGAKAPFIVCDVCYAYPWSYISPCLVSIKITCNVFS